MKNTIISTINGYYAGQDSEGDRVWTSNKSEAKVMSADTASRVCSDMNHYSPRTLRVTAEVAGLENAHRGPTHPATELGDGTERDYDSANPCD